MTSTPKYISLFAIFTTFFLLLSMASALCKHKSEIFQGHCVLHVRCNYRCQKLENAAFGLCQRSGLSGKECHCYFNECPQTSTTGEVHSNGTTTYEEAKTVFYEIHD